MSKRELKIRPLGGVHPPARLVGAGPCRIRRGVLASLLGWLLFAGLGLATTAGAQGFPQIAGVQSSVSNGNVTSFNVVLPAGVEEGDLLIVISGYRGGRTYTTSTVQFPAGWTELVTRTASNNGQGVVFYKVATATEAGAASINVAAAPSGGTGARQAHTVYRIQKGSFLGNPEASFVNATSLVSSTNPNPPALAPSWGTSPTLWIAAAAGTRAGTNPNPSTFVPTDFSSGTYVFDNSNTTTSSASVSTATRSALLGSLDPGSFTLTTTDHRAITIAVQGRATYAVEGRISGAVDAGVQVTLTDNDNANAVIASTTSDASGDFSLPVQEGAHVTLIPSLGGYAFEPANRVFTNVQNDLVGQDFVASAVQAHTISGQVVDYLGAGVAGVSVVLSGTAFDSVVTDASGAYSFTVSQGDSVAVTPAREGALINPMRRVFADVSSDQVQDFFSTSFPRVVATATYAAGSTTTSHPVTLPANIQAGDLLLMVMRPGGTAGVNVGGYPSGWTLLGTRGSSGNTYVWYKEALGTEGASVTVTTSASIRATAVTYRIAAGSWQGLAEIAFAGTNVNNPPALTPSWGKSPNLFIAAMTNRRSDSNVTAAPTDYDGLITIAPASSDQTTRTRVSSARRELFDDGDDPLAFTTTGTIDNPHSATLAIEALIGALGDVDSDGVIDGNDVMAIVMNFLGSGMWIRPDVNLDGIVDILDVIALINQILEP